VKEDADGKTDGFRYALPVLRLLHRPELEQPLTRAQGFLGQGELT